MLTHFRAWLRLGILLSVIASLSFFAIPAFAAGWAVITLDELPTNVIAEEPLAIGFTVLQHGRSPMDGLEPTVTATLSRGERFVVHAEPDGKPGHYTAALTFPREGEWSWSIQAFGMEQLMPPPRVAAPVAGSARQPVVETEPAPVSISQLFVVRVLAVAMGLVGLILAYQRKNRLALALTVAATQWEPLPSRPNQPPRRWRRRANRFPR